MAKFWKDKARRQATSVTEASSIFPYSRTKLIGLIQTLTPIHTGAGGAQGLQGAEGGDGPQGAQGAVGTVPVGPVGAQGADGDDPVGPAGDVPVGPIGADGDVGDNPTGAVGAVGNPLVGATGAAGDVPVGPAGDVPVGPAGDVPVGPVGLTGDDPVGPAGDVPVGPDGDQPVGPDGSTGGTGADGFIGPAGLTGPNQPAVPMTETPAGPCTAPSGVAPLCGTAGSHGSANVIVITSTARCEEGQGAYTGSGTDIDGTYTCSQTVNAGVTKYFRCDGDVDGDGDGTDNYSWLCAVQRSCCCNTITGTVNTYTEGTGYTAPSSDEDALYTGAGGSNQTCTYSWAWEKTCIVELSNQYRKLFAVEQPEVRFEEIFVCEPNGKTDMEFAIDPLFVEACEQDTLDVIGLMPSTPALIGAVVEGDVVKVRLKPLLTHFPEIPERIRVTISGKRRGFSTARFALSDQQEAERNRFFYGLANGDLA